MFFLNKEVVLLHGILKIVTINERFPEEILLI